MADFNGDGRLDVAVADSGDVTATEQGVSILMGNGDGTFQAPILYPAGTDPSSIVAGDWTGNGVIDLAVANNDSERCHRALGQRSRRVSSTPSDLTGRPGGRPGGDHGR